MLMNDLEFWLVNNPIRGFIQELIEIRKIRKLSQLPTNKIVLEIGCGNGYGTRLIKKYFKPKKITAIDLDKRMIDIAKRKHHDPIVTFEVGDAAKLVYQSNSFDAVFDFGIIHHIPNWEACLKELKRVLKPKGQLIIEDLSIETFKTFIGKVLKNIFDHPYSSMYEREELIDHLKILGFKIEKNEVYYHLGLLEYFIVIAAK